MDAFALKKIFLLGWPVLSVLLFCSVLSLALILERLAYFRKRKVDVKDFLKKVRGSEKSLTSLGEPLASVARAAAECQGKSRGNLDLAVDRAVRMQVSEMERSVPLLGTIASAAPFIGLLGTVLGIIRAFRSIEVSGGGGPQVVAGGIAEALVATALGLFVAIPALVAYNHFSTRIRRMTEDLEICADEIVTFFSKD
ncbi:MAG: hypothetical protein A2902_04405 [Elusimicrobia bacterium RIFCSPLOWO2_01_FULL_64_13]|nr:MAG: hypothetical protein A2636_05760 [Elusimicrobia bacterium RIFCSPHIGHO2_01_FULL_64_10]OGR95718.1 MAG: hypothetical protein A2902_04405 [Elusimicrobia bacterium RIFCSPLOWO2_01_FULL_64_13]